MAYRALSVAVGFLSKIVAVVVLASFAAAVINPPYHYAVFHTFTGADGANPVGQVLRDNSTGMYYAATRNGGSLGLGVVYKMDILGNETVLHNFPILLWLGRFLIRPAISTAPRAGPELLASGRERFLKLIRRATRVRCIPSPEGPTVPRRWEVGCRT